MNMLSLVVMFWGQAAPTPLEVKFQTACSELLAYELEPEHSRTADQESWSVGTGGSGYYGGCNCVQSPKDTGSIGCGKHSWWPYSSFWVWFSVGGVDGSKNPAAPECERPNPKAPQQATLWLLKGREREEPITKLESLDWVAGAPQEQVRVCLSTQEAEQFAGGDRWTGWGEETPEQVVYSPPATELLQLETEPSFVRLARGDAGRVLMSHGHSVVLYDQANNRHAWLVNLEATAVDDFKVDRWKIIQSGEFIDDRVVIRYRWGLGAESRRLSVQLGPDAVPVPGSSSEQQ